jgi:hypothetical protein
VIEYRGFKYQTALLAAKAFATRVLPSLTHLSDRTNLKQQAEDLEEFAFEGDSPTGVGLEVWRKLCRFCLEERIRDHFLYKG